MYHYIGKLMVGRWTGAIGVFNLSPGGKKIATVVVPLIAFAIILSVNRAYGSDVKDLFGYIIFIIIAIAAFFMDRKNLSRLC